MTAPTDFTAPRLRRALETIPAYVPGKPPAARDGVETFKLSSNENPYPPLPAVLEAVARAAASMNRYPDMGASRLYAALAQRWDVPVGDLAAGTGSVAVLYHLLQATCGDGDEVVYAWRSFEAYPIAVQMTGARSVAVPLASGARHDLPAMAAAVTERTRALIVCTPNNPTGPAVTAEQLAALVDAVPPSVLVVVDEAYVEFVRDAEVGDGIDCYRGRDNVVVLRTFSKAYGLAGLRLGYAIAPGRIAEAIRKVALPFGVSQIAQEAALASLAVEDQLLAQVDGVVEERQRVVGALRDHGWDVPDAQGNFFWLSLGEATMAFAAACDDAGAMVRPFAGDGVRVSIGSPAGNDRFLGAAAAWRATHG
ncbi:MAG: histidinol-phosphate transaminase [Nocardioidaceae bacterium]